MEGKFNLNPIIGPICLIQYLIFHDQFIQANLIIIEPI